MTGRCLGPTLLEFRLARLVPPRLAHKPLRKILKSNFVLNANIADRDFHHAL
jgi:hypothetical protein